MGDLESANKQGSGSGIDKNEETPMTGPLENDVINALRRKANSVPDARERTPFLDRLQPPNRQLAASGSGCHGKFHGRR